MFTDLDKANAEIEAQRAKYENLFRMDLAPTREMLHRLYEFCLDDEAHELDVDGKTCHADGMPWPCVVEEVHLFLGEKT